MIKQFRAPRSYNRTEPMVAIIRQIHMDSKIQDTPEKRKQRLDNYIKVMQQYA